MSVPYPSASSDTNSWAPASLAARSTASRGASGSAKAMLAAMVSLNRNVSSNTMPTAPRSSCRANVRTSAPSMATAPPSTS